MLTGVAFVTRDGSRSDNLLVPSELYMRVMRPVITMHLYEEYSYHPTGSIIFSLWPKSKLSSHVPVSCTQQASLCDPENRRSKD
jgi:hypothetical protein